MSIGVDQWVVTLDVVARCVALLYPSGVTRLEYRSRLADITVAGGRRLVNRYVFLCVFHGMGWQPWSLYYLYLQSHMHFRTKQTYMDPVP